MRRRAILVLAVLCLAISAYTALADVSQIRGHFEGIIHAANPMDDIYDWSELEAQFSIGKTISGEFYYSREADVIWDHTNASGSETLYTVDYAEVSSGDFVGYAPCAELGIIDNYYGNGDQYCLWADQPDNGVFGTGVSFPLWAFGFGVVNRTGSIFEGSELPLTVPDLSAFDDDCPTITLHFVRDVDNPNNGSFVVDATMTSLEPAYLVGYTATRTTNSTVYSASFDAGEQTLLGSPSGIYYIHSMAVSPDGGRLFATGGSPMQGRLYVIDTDTGIGNELSVPYPGIGTSVKIAFSNDGTLFGVSQTFSEYPAQLMTLDTDTGQKEVISSLAPYNQITAFAIDSSGKGIAWDSGWLVEIDLTDGTTTSLGPLSTDFTAFAYGVNNDLYAWSGNRLYSLNPDTLEIALLHTFSIDGYSMAIIPNAAPTPTIHNVTQDTFHATIQDAVDTATHGDTIEVPPDTYTGPGNYDVDFRGKAITVRSEDPNDLNVVAATIIDCNGTAADPHRGFCFHSGETPNAVVAGFTITRGVTGSGGGILCTNGSSPTIKNNIIKGNYILYDYDGGGGIGCWDGASPIISNNIICDNYCEPGGGGGGIRCYEAGSPKIVSNVFIGNHANVGGAIEFAYNNIGGLVEDNLIIGNTASWAAGIVCWGTGDITIKNNTIVANMAAEYTGGVEIHCTDTVWVTNCILWGNSDAEIEGDAQVTYCDVEGGYPGEGNIDADPCFADAEGGDYHLKSQAGRWDPDSKTWVKDEVTSPCIDAGDPTSAIGWEPYPNGGIVNIGIYGGTTEASKSYFGGPVCRNPIVGDSNGDCRVDFTDFVLMALHWCEDNNP